MNDITVRRLADEILEIGAKIIAVDGRSAAGKTTLAAELSTVLGCGVVHMDDFFLPPEMRTPERLSQPGGNVDRERFAAEVLPFLGAEFEYGAFSCSNGCIDRKVHVPAGRVIIEGAYSMHPAFGEYFDFGIFADISPELQKQRIIARSGEEKWEQFREKWIPMEELYHSTFDTAARCRVRLSDSALKEGE